MIPRSLFVDVAFISSQFQRTLAADALLGIAGEGGEAVDLLKDAKVELSRVDVLKAAEGFVVLGEDPNRVISKNSGERPRTLQFAH